MIARSLILSALVLAATANYIKTSGCDSSKCPAVNGEFPVHFPHNSDCAKFCKCDKGIAYEIDCPEGFHFNPTLDVCDWPETAGCDGTATSPDPETSETPEEIPSTSAPTGKCDSSKCPAVNGESPIHFAHPDDCGKFCKCDEGIAYEMECQDGLHFNPDLEVCDWPETAGCDGTVKGPVPIEVETKGLGCESVTCPAVNDGPFPVYLPHPSDCEKYCQCDAGVAYEMTCPPGLEFGWKGVCDWPWDARCTVGQ